MEVGLLHPIGSHGRVGRAEIDRAIDDLGLTAARANGLVVQLKADRGLRGLSPLRIDRCGKCRASTGDLLGLGRKGKAGQGDGERGGFEKHYVCLRDSGLIARRNLCTTGDGYVSIL